jgi:hypothetical protein
MGTPILRYSENFTGALDWPNRSRPPRRTARCFFLTNNLGSFLKLRTSPFFLFLSLILFIPQQDFQASLCQVLESLVNFIS